VTTFLEKLEISGNFIAVRELLGKNLDRENFSVDFMFGATPVFSSLVVASYF